MQPNAPGSQGYNPYAYVANNPTTWVDPSGYSSALPTNLTPGQTAILVSLMVSLPAMLLVPGVVGVPFLIFALTIHCALTQGCLPRLKEMNKLIDTLGSSGINTVEWTIETLNTAFAKYPLLPEAPPAMQFMAGMGLGLLGLDTVTDFATLISGRDPITGHALTPQEMFVTWIAFSLPLVTASFLRSFADDTIDVIGFRGVDFKMDGGKYANEAPLILAGHVGISFDGGKTIYGFHPAVSATAGLSGPEIINQLREGGSFAGQVYDDTAVFVKAYELGQQGALSRGATGAQLPMAVYMWRQQLPATQVRQIRESVLRQVADPSVTSSRYSFPNKGPSGYYMPTGCNNCATRPSV